MTELVQHVMEVRCLAGREGAAMAAHEGLQSQEQLACRLEAKCPMGRQDRHQVAQLTASLPPNTSAPGREATGGCSGCVCFLNINIDT